MRNNHAKKAFQSHHFKRSLQTHKLLAQERTILACERNTLAYIRTGFAAFALGVVLIKLFDKSQTYMSGGWVSMGLGILFIILGIVYYPLRKRRIESH